MPNKKKLYEALKAEGYDNFADESSFNAYVDNSDNRKKLFSALKKEGYDNFADETEFEKYLGYNSEDNAVFEANAERFRNGQPIERVTTQSVIDANPELGSQQPVITPYSIERASLKEQVASNSRKFPKMGDLPWAKPQGGPDGYVHTTDLSERLNRTYQDGGMESFLHSEEDEKIKAQYTPKEEKTTADVWGNAMNKFALTERGGQLQTELAQIQDEITNKYLEEFKNSDEYKQFLGKKYATKDEEYKANKAVNDLFNARYAEAINNDMQPYMQAYNNEVMHRYGVDVESGLNNIAKKEAVETLGNLSTSVNADLEKIEDAITSRQKAVRNIDWKPGMPSSRDDAKLSELRDQRTYLEGAKELIEDSQNILNAVEAEKDGSFFGGLGRGVSDKAFDIDTWTMGLSDLVGGLRLKSVLEKAEKGETLTPAEQKLLDASVNNMAVNFYYRNDLGLGYQAGEITGQSIPFMLEFLVNPVSASGNAMAKRLLTYGLKRFGSAVNSKAIKAGTRLATDALAAGGITATTGMGHVLSGGIERLNRNYEYGLDEEGNLNVVNTHNMGVGEAFAKSATSAFLERQSEMIFNAFRGAPSLFKGIETSLPGGVNTFMNYVINSRLGELWKGIKNNATMKELAKRTQFHGLGEEYLEEVYNNFANIPLGEMTFEEATDLENNIVTFLGLAPTQVMFSAIGGIGYGVERYKAKRDLERTFGKMTEEQKRKLMELQEMGKLSTNKDIAFFLAETIKDESLTPEQKRAEIEYAYNLAKQNAIDEVSNTDVEDSIESENQQIDAATDPQTGMYGEVMLTSQDLDGNNVVTPANVFGEKEVNGELYLLVLPEGEAEKKWVRPNQYDANSYQKRPSEEVKALNEEMIREEAAQQAEQEAKYAPEVLNAQMPEGEFTMGGQLFVPSQVTSDGVVYDIFDLNEKGKPTTTIPIESRPVAIDEYRDMLQAQLNAEEAAQEQIADEEQAASPEVVEEVQPIQPTEEARPIVEGVANQSQAEQPKQPTLEEVIATLPKTNKGEIDYKAMTPQQQYQYTSITESPEVALEDLQADITAGQEEIVKKQEKLTKAKGGERAALRDEVRKLTQAQAELQAFYDSVAPKQEAVEETAQPVEEAVKEPTAQAEVAQPQAEATEEQVEVQPSEEVSTPEVATEQANVTPEQTEAEEQKEGEETAEPIQTEPLQMKEGESALQFAERAAEENRRRPLRKRAEEWSNTLGIKVTYLESIDDVDARTRAEIEAAHAKGKSVPGWVNKKGEVFFFMPDLSDLKDVDDTYIHEVVAHVGLPQLLGKERFGELCDKVWEMMPQSAKDYYMSYPGVKNHRDAADEYIAHLAEQQNLTPEEKTIWDNIVKMFREMLDKALNGIISKSKLTDEDISNLIKASYANLKSGVEGGVSNAEGNRMRAVERIEENVGEVDAEKGDVRFAVRDVLKGEARTQAIKDLMSVTGRSKRTVEKWLKAEESLASVILNEDNVGILDLEADESVPSIWKNSDYPQGTVEFSNICKKRLPFTTIYQRLQKEFPDTLFDAQTLNTIRNTMKEMGEDVACALCFVEDRRQLLGEIGQGFIDAVKGKEVEVNDNQKAALNKLKESGDKYVPNLFDIITLDGMKELRKKHPAVAQAFIEYNNARGMQSGRLFQAYSAYNREILKYNKKKVESINNNGGLRIFSFSDFEAHHLIDLVQVLTDCAAKGIKVQGYTKVPEFAKAVKDTNAKINRSLIPKGVGYVDADYVPKEGEAVSPNVINGKRLLFDTIEGIDVNNPNFFDSTNSKSVGNILVAINDEHARLAMADPFVDYIIGFHTGQSKAILKGKGIDTWVNYKNEQLDKEIVTDENGNQKMKNAPKHGLNIYTDVLNVADAEGNPIKTAKQFTERFIEECNKRGWIPRFHRFLNRAKDGRFLYTPGYHKFLIDFKLFDKNGKILPQEAVVPVFDNEFNKQILDEYVKGVKEEMPNDAVYEAVKEAVGLGSDVQEGKTSFRVTFTPEEQTIIKKAKADGTYMLAPNGEPTNLTEKQWAQVRTKAFKKWFGDWESDAQNASKIVDENGEPLVVYHGSEEDFNEFDKTRGRANMDIQGMFFSPWDDDARGYGSNVRAFYLNIRKPANESTGYKALKKFQGQNGAGIKAREYLASVGYDGVNNEDQEFIAFEANQIKSATDNVGIFDEGNNDIRFRFIGERGARNLDKAEEATTRLDNLAVAKEMEAAEKDAKAIKMATGWERGADGKWRYETEDVKLKGFDWISQKKALKLQDIVDDNELFTAYPILSEIKIKKGRGYRGGSYSNEKKELELKLGEIREDIKYFGYVTSYNEKYFKETVIHEIQHAIQDIEGFASGGSSSTIIDQQIWDKINKLTAEVDELYAEWDRMPDSEKKITNPVAKRMNDEVGAKRKEIDRLFKDGAIGYEGYKKLSGEVEARNAATRMNMSEEERRKTLASETEDVAREDQIFLKDGIESGMRFRLSEKGKQIQAEVDKFTSKYNSKPVRIVEAEMDDNELMETLGYAFELEDVKSFMKESKTAAGYFHNLDKIIIFADKTKVERMEEYLFHENIHAAIHHNNFANLVAHFYEYAKNEAVFEKWSKLAHNKEYKQYNSSEEFLAYVVSNAMVARNLDEVAEYLGEKQKKALNKLFNVIGYDYDIRRRSDEQSVNGRTSEETSGESSLEGNELLNTGEGRGTGEGIGKGKSGKVSAAERKARLNELFNKVADMGLKGVLGNKEYTSLMVDIYKALPEEVRAEIAEYALRLYGGSVAPAVSDYIGPKSKNSIMDKVVTIVREALRKIGFDLDLNANEVRYMAWRSKKPLDRNNMFEVAEDIDMKYRLKVGEYDGTTPDGGGTRFRVANKLQVRDEYEATIKKGGYQAREAVQDAMLSLRRFQELIEKASGKKIRDFENAWMHENRLSSVVQAEIHDMERRFYKPMMDAVKKLMKAANLEQEQVADYLMLKHGIERNREMAVRKALTDDKGKIDRTRLEQWYQDKRNVRNRAATPHLDTWRKQQEELDNIALLYGADMSRDYSGLTSMFGTDDLADSTQKAYDEVEALENAHPVETESLGKAIKAMTQNTLDKSFESGLMDRKVYDELSKDMYDYYIPLRGFEETTSEEVYAYLDQDRGAFNAPLKRAKGRSSKSDNPIAYLKSIAESGIMQGNRNKMKQSFLNMVINHPSDLVSVREGVWVIYNQASGEWEAASAPAIPKNATPADVEAAMEAWEQQMEQAAQNDPNIKKVSEAADVPYRVVGNRMDQHQVIVKRLGKSYTLTINGNPRLAMAINGQTNPNNTSNDGKVASFVNNKIGALNRSLAAWYTTRNPDFVASNFMRDTFYTNTIVRAKEGNAYANKFHKNYATVLPKMLGLFRKYENGTLNPADQTEAAFLDFMMNGGETGYSNLKDVEEIKKQISKELKGNRFAKVEALAEKLDILNRAVENTARFAAFLTSREEGRSIAKSIFDAKEISVNFNKKGAGGTFFGMTGQTWFGNLAAMVGAGGRALYVFFNAAIQGSTNLMHVMKVNPKGTSAGLAAMFLMGAVVPFLFGGDDDDEKDYYDLPEHVRRNHLIIPGAGDAWVSIPLPIEYRIMYGIGELLTSWRTGHERGTDIARKMLSMTGQALPLNFLEEGLEAFVPSAVSPVYQVMTNSSWTGLPIYKENDFNKDDPEYTKAYSNVDRNLLKFTKALYEWSFDEENQKERIDLNPAIIETLAKGYFGGLATQLSNIAKVGGMIAGEQEFDWRNIPIGNRILKTGDERTKEKRVTNEYFENMEKLDFLQSRERMLKKTEKGVAVPEADKFKAQKDLETMQGTEVYKKYQEFKKQKKVVDKIRKTIKEKGSTPEREKQLMEAQEKANKSVR